MTRQETTSRGLTERDSSKEKDHHRDSAKRSRFLAKEKKGEMNACLKPSMHEIVLACYIFVWYNFFKDRSKTIERKKKISIIL